MMMKQLALLLAVIFFSPSSYASGVLDALKDLTPEQKEKLKNLPEDKKREFLNMTFMLMAAERRSKQKAAAKKITPVRLKTGKEGLVIKSKIPFIGEKPGELTFRMFKSSPEIKNEDFIARDILDHCTACFKARKYPEEGFVYKYYPIGSTFVLEEFIRIPRWIIMVLRDESGKKVFVHDFKVKDILDGGNGGFQNSELLLLDQLTLGKNQVNMKVELEELAFRNFQDEMKGNRKYWDFPPFPSKADPGLDSKDIQGWLTFAAKGFRTGKAVTLSVENLKEAPHEITFDIAADIETFVILLYTGFIVPYSNKMNGNAFTSLYRKRWEGHNNYPLGEDADSFIEKLKIASRPSHLPTPTLPISKSEEEAKRKYFENLNKKLKSAPDSQK